MDRIYFDTKSSPIMKRQKIKKVFCSHCNRQLYRYAYYVEKWDNFFCNIKCKSDFQKKPKGTVTVTEGNIEAYKLFAEFKDVQAAVNISQFSAEYICDSYTKIQAIRFDSAISKNKIR